MSKLSKYRVLVSGILSPLAALFLYALVYGTLTRGSADREKDWLFRLSLATLAMTELARRVAAGYKANGLAWIFGRLPALTAQSAERSRHSWRRQLCRELLLRMS